jgi:primosomal protein N'
VVAQVVPILRLRRDTTWWSYKVPHRTQCLPGSLVVVPFRGRATLGIVWSIGESDEKASLEIEQVLCHQPLVRTPLRRFIEHVSYVGLCSLSTALYVWLPTGMRSLPLSAKARQLLGNYVKEDISLDKTTSQQHLILLPQIRSETSRSLANKFGIRFADLFAGTSADKELEEWFGILTGKVQVALGRERALFAPWLSLRQITIVDPADIAFYHEQVPYCSMIGLVKDLASNFSSRTRVKTTLPTEISRELWGTDAEGQDMLPRLKITDLSQTQLLGEDLIRSIKETYAKGKTVLILYNAHDRISSRTTDGREEKILMPGIETLARKLAHLLDLGDLPPEVILGTRSIFEKTHADVGLTVALSIDLMLSQTIFADHLHGCADLGHLFKYDAPCIIQAHHKEHPLLHALRNNQFNSYLANLVAEQQANHLPPFGQQIFCSLPSEGAEVPARELYARLAPLIKAPWTISFPFAANWRKKPFLHVMLHSDNPHERLPGAVREIITQLPRPWRIQHNPWYIL